MINYLVIISLSHTHTHIYINVVRGLRKGIARVSQNEREHRIMYVYAVRLYVILYHGLGTFEPLGGSYAGMLCVFVSIYCAQKLNVKNNEQWFWRKTKKEILMSFRGFGHGKEWWRLIYSLVLS